MSKKFDEFRFAGLGVKSLSNQYLTMNRISEDAQKIVVKVADCHLFKTAYGYGLILDARHVVWLKDWQVSCNYFGNEVVLDRGYFAVKEWPPEKDKVLRDFFEDEEACEWGHWEHIAAIQQEAGNVVKWKK